MYFLFTTFWDSKWQPKCLGIIIHWAKDSRICTPITENQDSNLMNFVNLVKYVVEVLSMKHQFLLLLKKNPPAGVANKLSFCWYCFPLIGCSYSTSALNFPFSWSSLPPWKTWILGRTLLHYSKSIGLITTLQPITVVRFFWFLSAALSSLRNLEIFLRYFLTSRKVFLQLLLLAYNHWS